MKVHQELRIGPLTAEQESKFIAQVVERLTTGWSRDREREIELNRETGGTFYCFDCQQAQDRPSARLFLTHAARRVSWLYVSNIVPQEIQCLSVDQYNHILNEFETLFARPAADCARVEVELSQAEQSIEQWLSPQSAKCLRTFSIAANKSTGSSHPADRERWYDFLIAVHRSGDKPDVGLLQRWLMEEEQWPDDISFDLVSEYTFAMGLLDRFDR